MGGHCLRVRCSQERASLETYITKALYPKLTCGAGI